MRRGKTELSVQSFKGTSERQAGRLPPARHSVSLESPDSEPSQTAKICSAYTHVSKYTHIHIHPLACTCKTHWWLLPYAVCQDQVLIHKTDHGLIPASCLSSARRNPSPRKDRSNCFDTYQVFSCRRLVLGSSRVQRGRVALRRTERKSVLPEKIKEQGTLGTFRHRTDDHQQ